MKNFAVLFLTFSIASCQMTPSRNMSRSIANTSLLRSFLKEVADQSEKMAAKELQSQLDARFKEFIREEAPNGQSGNWARMGITKDQAMKIDSLYDDLPYMNKVQKWVMENMTVLMKEVKPSIAAKAYSSIAGNAGGLYNPYKGLSDDVGSAVSSRRSQTMPDNMRRRQAQPKEASVVQELHSRNTRLIAAIEEVNKADPKALEYLKVNLERSKEMISKNPLVASNIHHSLEGALLITKKTGKRSLGPGCEAFNGKASERILELKSRVDMRRAELVEQRAYDKAGFVFNKVDEVPAANRVTESEIDELTEQAFSDVLGYTRLEAKAAIKRLKSKPCKIY
ncbi:MAG: hypothetical protein KC478_09890 [Bacteriovoracaceae bacterium]|nr:hypothetical protein [Bacteriovoracaceae bacterium]